MLKYVQNTMVCCIVLGGMCVPLLVEAANLTFVNDTISNSQPGVGVNHTIKFTVTNSIPASGKIVITFQAGAFTIPSGFDVGDVDLLVGGTNRALAPSPGLGLGSAIGVLVTAGTLGSITFTLNDTDILSTGSVVVIKVGTNATFSQPGDQQILTPTIQGSYRVGIKTSNAVLATIDEAYAMIAIVDVVLVGAGGATRRIVGSVVKPDNVALTATERQKLSVFAHQFGVQGDLQTSIASDGTFTFVVSSGVWKIGVGGFDLPILTEVHIDIDDTYTFSNPPKGPTLVIDLPSNFIEGFSRDSLGNGLSNISVYAWQDLTVDKGRATTNTQGYYKMYVPSGDYHVGAYSQNFGFLGEQSNITVSESAHPTVNFTVSSNVFTIAGRVTKNGDGLQDAFVFVTNGEKGSTVGGGKTDTNGFYSANVFGGTDRWLHVGLPAKGEMHKESIGTITANISNKNIGIAVSAIKVRISPAASFTQAFIGVHGVPGDGFSDTNVALSGALYKEYHLEVSKPSSGSATYHVQGNVPGYGPLPALAVELSSGGNFVESSGTPNDGMIEYSVNDFFTVSGTVSGSNVLGAWVWAASSSGGNNVSVALDGTYVLKLRNGAYDIGVNKPGYTGNSIAITISGFDKPGQNLILTSATQTIQGRVYFPDGVTLARNAWVWAENGVGGVSSVTSNANGEYVLNVSSGDWLVRAASDGFTSVKQIISGGVSSTNIILTPITTFNFVGDLKTSTIIPSEGGIVQGTGVQIGFPAGVLGTDTSTGTVELKSTTNFPATADMKVIGDKAQDVTFLDSSQRTISTFSGNISIELTVTKQEVLNAGVAFSQLQQMSIAYWDGTANSWIKIPTIVKLNPGIATAINGLNPDSAVILSGSVNHLSYFAPTLPTSVNAPSTPTELSAVAGNEQVILSWNTSAGAAQYNVYQQFGNSYQYIAKTSQTSYTVSGIVNGTSYSFKVSSLNTDDNESAATSAIVAIPALIIAGAPATASGVTSTSTPSTSTPFVEGRVPVARIADLSKDGTVDLVDFSILLYNWGAPKNTLTDINKDGIVDLVDFSILLYWWTG